MWNKLYTNRFLNEEDKFYDHKLFCERIALTKSYCNTTPPNEYRFLKIRAKKEMMNKEKQMNTDYNNNLLIRKLIEMEKKPQQYHPKSQKFYPHPVSLRFSKTSSKHHEYDNANEYLKKRIDSAKSVYSRYKSLKDYQKNVYIENLLLKNSKHYNPYMNFATPDMFQRNLCQRLMTSHGKTFNKKQKMRMNKERNSDSFNNNKYVIDAEMTNTQHDSFKMKSQPLKYEIVRSTDADDIETRMLTKYSIN